MNPTSNRNNFLNTNNSNEPTINSENRSFSVEEYIAHQRANHSLIAGTITNEDQNDERTQEIDDLVRQLIHPGSSDNSTPENS